MVVAENRVRNHPIFINLKLSKVVPEHIMRPEPELAFSTEEKEAYMMRKYGSQIREPVEEAGFTVAGHIDDDTVVLQHNTDGKFEVWSKKDDFAGYVVEIDGVGYEFYHTAQNMDLKAAGII